MSLIIAGIIMLTSAVAIGNREADMQLDSIQQGREVQLQAGKEIFVALHSGLGSEKYGIPQLVERQPLTPEEELAWGEIVNALEVKGYDFEEFLSQVTSGNPYEVERALSEGTNLIVPPGSETENSKSPACGLTFCIGVVVLVAVAAVVSTLAGGYNYVGGVNVYLKALVWGPSAKAEGTGLLMEENVATVTKALAG